ncbi:MAG: GAF domain-containing protein [Microbacteriaceae bacterium]|nr:GAF domain-containing protein [Microbacteriaceae bacterium]
MVVTARENRGENHTARVDPLDGDRILEQLATLADLAGDLAGEFRLQPLLERILTNAVELLGCTSGSICTIDERAKVYRKDVDLGVGCRSGENFPLDEGVTGAVVRAGGPVTFAHYSDVPGGHIRADDERYGHPVIGVPIRIRSTLIGVCVVFAEHDARVFDETDAKLLELFATHAAVAIANSRLHTAATERAASITIAAERERSMRDVHDAVGRSVATVLLHLDGARKTARLGGDVAASLDEARAAAVAALDETDRAVQGLGPSLLDRHSLEEAIGLELDWATATSDARTQLLVMGERAAISPDVEQQLFRIVQEAVGNAAAHAGAGSIRVGLVYGSAGVSLIVEDDGRGFDAGARAAAGHGLGLGGLLSRAQQVGGTIQIDSTPGWGTRVRADLPYAVPTTDDELVRRWRVLVIHDQPVIRAGLVGLLANAEPGVQVVGEIGDAARSADAVALLHPDVVLADLHSPGFSGAGLVTAITEANPRTAVILLVGSRDDELVREAAQAGARGFVDRTVDAVSLGRAVLSAVNGDVLVSGDLVNTLGGWRSPEADSPLTPREREVRALVEQGWQDKQIAGDLGIAVKTVEKHVGSILRKTGARNRTILAAIASTRV